MIAALLGGCGGDDANQATNLPDPALGPPGGEAICPIDPDCFSVGTCEAMRLRCADVWRCEDVEDLGEGANAELAGFGKRCWNDSSFPDGRGGGSWDCEQVGDLLVCRGSDYPAEGSGSGWTCRMEGEFVVCERDATYPDDGGGTAWLCYYGGEFRICDGDGDPPDVPPGGGGGPFDCYVTSEFEIDCGDDGDVPAGGDDYCWEADPSMADPTVVGVGTIVHGALASGTIDGVAALYVRFAFTQAFVDNTYGANSSGGWGRRGHTFRELVGSDHATVQLSNGDGDVALEFTLDYISSDDGAPSSYRALGVSGGDGSMTTGDESAVLHSITSLDRNLNQRGCVFLADSPIGATCPDWDPQVVYEVFVREDVFGPSGVGGPAIGEVHASPSKFENNTVPVIRAPCP